MANGDFHIVGGGIIGLAVAYRLAQAGASVTVIEDGRPGQAGRAAAGMLAPLAESAAAPSVETLGIPSLLQYPAFLEELGEVSGQRVRLFGPGIIRLARTPEEAEILCASREKHAGVGIPLHVVQPNALRTLEPSLRGQVELAIHSPLERHVVPTQLIAALEAACKRLRVQRIAAGVSQFTASGGRITGITTTSGTLTCDQVIVTAGAWSPHLIEPLGLHLPIAPVKGQLLHVHPAIPVLRHTVFTEGLYLVPRASGDLVIGATEEPECGFDTEVTKAAIDGLVANAAKLIPRLAHAPRVESHAGLRPVTPDKLPCIGRIPHVENLIVAAGHGRNGILMTPITAQIVADLAIRGIGPPALVSPERFAGSSS